MYFLLQDRMHLSELGCFITKPEPVACVPPAPLFLQRADTDAI